MKKLITLGTILVAMSLTTVTAFAAGGNGNRAALRDGTGTRVGTGRGVTGIGQNLGSGGLGLQDGSCYIGEDGYLYYKDTNERVLNNGNPVRQGTGLGNGGTAQGLGIGGMMLQDGSCYTVQ